MRAVQEDPRCPRRHHGARRVPRARSNDLGEPFTIQKAVGGFSTEREYAELRDAIGVFDSDRYIPWKTRVKLIKGNIEESLPAFVHDNPGVRFSLIHFDCDLYKPTKVALVTLWPIVSRGGIMIFDEYGIPDWPGETKAVDEFLSENPDVRLRTFDWTNVPADYLIKD